MVQEKGLLERSAVKGNLNENRSTCSHMIYDTAQLLKPERRVERLFFSWGIQERLWEICRQEEQTRRLRASSLGGPRNPN